MAKDKNFSITRNKISETKYIKDVKIGDVFEREGSLHMRIDMAEQVNRTCYKFWIVNLNTGAVFPLVNHNEVTREVADVTIDYTVEV